MIIHDIPQGSEEWHKVRLGKITASQFHTLAGTSQTRQTLLYKIAAERITGKLNDQDSFSNIHTSRGHELEDNARTAFELATGLDVKQVGFIEINENLGFSPDGLIGDDEGLEIKCPDNHSFLRIVHSENIPAPHLWQIKFSLYFSKRKYWHYVIYNPNFKNHIWINDTWENDIIPSDSDIRMIEDTITRAEDDIKQIIKAYKYNIM